MSSCSSGTVQVIKAGGLASKLASKQAALAAFLHLSFWLGPVVVPFLSTLGGSPFPYVPCAATTTAATAAAAAVLLLLLP